MPPQDPKLCPAALARLTAAKNWAAPSDEHILASEQLIWATGKMRRAGLDSEAAALALSPLTRCDPMAWDRLCDELLAQVPRNKLPPALAKFLTVRLVETCPDQERWQRAARLVRLVLGADQIGLRDIGKSGAIVHAARYYYVYNRAGIAVGVREIAAYAGVSHALAAKWVARWRRGEPLTIWDGGQTIWDDGATVWDCGGPVTYPPHTVASLRRP